MGAFVQRADIIGPDAGGIDDHPGPHIELGRGVGRVGPEHGTGRLAELVGGQPDDVGVVGHYRAVFKGGGASQGEREAGVVGAGVVVEESGHQVLGAQGGQVRQRLLLVHPLVPGADAQAPGEVVEPQGTGVGTGHRLGDHAVTAEEGDEKGQRADQMGRVVQQALALGQVLVDQSEFTLLEVAQAAVDHFG